MHVPLQDELQQTPSAHAPLAHSVPVVQAEPSVRPTQTLFVHTGVAGVPAQSALPQQPAGAVAGTHRFVPGQFL
jgi:hypothetical protein